MQNWDDIRKKKIMKHCNDLRVKFLGYNVFSKRTTQGILFEELGNYDIVFGYDKENKVYLVWSTAGHRIIDSTAKEHTFSLHKNWSKLKNVDEEIMCFYQRLEGTKKPEYSRLEYYEKIVLIRESCVVEFCKNPIMYLMPNKMDANYQAGTVFLDCVTHKVQISDSANDARWYSDKERERYCCYRLSRDASFRKRVLDAWGHKCAICKEDILEVLEAAHIIPVEKGGTDATENGLCLCANHHLMFDNDMFHFDTNTGKLSSIDKRLTGKMPNRIQSR